MAHVVIYVAHCIPDIFTSQSVFLEWLLPQSRRWAFTHSDSSAVKMLLTTTVSDKIALGTNNFIWMFCPSDVRQSKTSQLLSPSVSPSTRIYSSDSQSQLGFTPQLTVAKDQLEILPANVRCSLTCGGLEVTHNDPVFVYYWSTVS